MLNFLLIGLLIIFNGLFAASEIAVLSVNANKIEEMANNGHRKAKQVMKFIEKPTKFLSTIQTGITFVGFIASASASEAFADEVSKAIASILNNPGAWESIKPVAIVIVTLILSYVTIVFGELVPKRLAMKKPEAVAFFMVGLLRFLATLMRPFVMLLTFSTNLVIRIFGMDPNQEDNPITEDEIRTMVDAGGEKGVIDQSEKEMINNIFEFDDTEVSEIMTHRTEVAGIPFDATIDEIVQLVYHEK
jgi:putative hemolysin